LDVARSGTASTGWSRRARRIDMQRRRAIVYSHGRAAMGLAGAHDPAVPGQERVLDDLLGLGGGAQHLAAEREQRLVMPIEERLERAVGARA
jgi:hypothetical protein